MTIPVIGNQNGNIPVIGNNQVGTVPVMCGQQNGVPVVGMGVPATLSPVPVQNGYMQPIQQNSYAGGILDTFGQPVNSLANVGGVTQTPSGLQRLIIRKLVLLETKAQSDQYSRVIIPRVDNNTVNIMGEYLGASKSVGLNSRDIGNMQAQGANFFAVSPQTGTQISIPNGWGNKRFRFTLTLDVYIGDTLSCTEYVTGYTDEVGANFATNSLNPNMVFYIDSVSKSQRTQMRGANGGVGHNIVSSDLVISKSNVTGFGQPQHVVTMRPQDVFAELSVKAQREGAQLAAGLVGGPADMSASYVNMNTTVNARPSMSKAVNNIPSNFAASIFDAHNKAFTLSKEGTDIYRTARSQVNERAFTSSAFVHMIESKVGTMHGVVGNSFNLSALYSLDPVLQNSTDDRIVVIRPDNFMRELRRLNSGEVVSIPPGTECGSLIDTSVEVANVATVLHTANANFRNAGVSYISCVLTNYSGDHQAVVTSLLGVDDGMLYARAVAACENTIAECVRGITQDQLSYMIEITMDVHNDAYIKYTIGMAPAKEFVIPCYALGAISPVVAVGQNSLDNIVSSVRDVTDTLFGQTLTLGDMGFDHGSVSY